MVLGAVPDVDERVSQEALEVAVQLTVPKPAFVIESVWEGGLACPWNTEKVRLDGETANVGGATVSVTGITIGELLAPAALNVMLAV